MLARYATVAPASILDPSGGYCQVDEKLADRPPRYWARVRREPTMLGIRNGCQPQLDSTIGAFEADALDKLKFE